MSKITLPWNAAHDMPHNREQALSVLAAWGDPSCATFSAGRARRVHECLTTDVPKRLPPCTAYGRHLGGWAWGDADGWHGGFESREDALFGALAAGHV